MAALLFLGKRSTLCLSVTLLQLPRQSTGMRGLQAIQGADPKQLWFVGLQAPVPAFVPHRSPVPTPTANYAPTQFGGSGPATPPQPAQPPPPPAPTGPPANVNISNVDTSKVHLSARLSALP